MVLDALPPRPLSDRELARVNESESVAYAAPADGATENDAEGHRGLLVVTDEWAAGLALGSDGWETALRIEDYDDRFEAVRECEVAVATAHGKDSQRAGE